MSILPEYLCPISPARLAMLPEEADRVSEVILAKLGGTGDPPSGESLMRDPKCHQVVYAFELPVEGSPSMEEIKATLPQGVMLLSVERLGDPEDDEPQETVLTLGLLFC